MGFLKKITRPISKVLDKIVPNEIKPALPFLAAAVPFLAPQAGIFGTMAGRAALSGGSNLLAQLAQEGSEGDFSGLSTLLAAGTGALTAGGPSKAIGVDSPAAKNAIVRSEATGAPKFFADKAAGMDPGFTKSGLEALGKGSEYLSGVGETLRTNPFSMEGIKASIVPITQGTTDLAVAEGRRLEKQQAIDDALAQAELLEDSGARAAAIRQFMEGAGYFSDEEIEETISAAGYKAGGRVGFDNGGDVVIDTLRILPDTLDKISEKIAPFLGYDNLDELKIKNNPNLKNDEDPDFSGIKGAVEGVDKNMRADRAGDFFRLREEAIQKGDDDKIKEIESDFFKEFGMVMPKMAKDGGLMNLGGKEMDLRKGGFVPIGKKERADDVPARLSKNEFVMTADAVRGAGGGDINKGAKRMYETMNRLEARA